MINLILFIQLKILDFSLVLLPKYYRRNYSNYIYYTFYYGLQYIFSFVKMSVFDTASQVCFVLFFWRLHSQMAIEFFSFIIFLNVDILIVLPELPHLKRQVFITGKLWFLYGVLPTYFSLEKSPFLNGTLSAI